MARKTRKRPLAFETLENKALPTSILLALAPLGDSFHGPAEQWQEAGPTTLSHSELPAVDTSLNWRVQFSTHDLLRFVHENTHTHVGDQAPAATPSWDECRCVDEMMKLDQPDMRALVIADSLAGE